MVRNNNKDRSVFYNGGVVNCASVITDSFAS